MTGLGVLGALRVAPPDPGVRSTGEMGQVRPDLLGLTDARQRIVDEIRRTVSDHDTDRSRVTVIAASTGAGKTEAALAEICRLAAEDQRVLYSPPTLNEQKRIWLALKEQGVNAAQYWARSPDPDNPGWCQRHEEVGMLGPRNRWTAPLACASCPFGLAAMSEIHDQAGNATKAAATRQRIHDEHHVEDETVTPCKWILTKYASLDAPVLIACHAAFTPSLAEGRHVVVDEEPEVGRWLSVDPDALHDWIDGLPAIERGLRKEAERLEARAVIEQRRGRELDRLMATELRQEAAETTSQADRLALQVGAWLTDLRSHLLTEMIDPTRRKMPSEMAEIIVRLARWAKPVQDNASVWERATMTWGMTPSVPLRAIMDLARAIEMDAVWVDGHGIHAVVPTAIGAELLDPNQDVLVLCATPTVMLRDIAHRVVDIPIDQGVELTLFPRHTWGKAGLRTDPATLDATRKWTRRFMAAMSHELCAEPWGASHAAIEDGSDGDPVTIHYGAHRGRNDCAGRPGLVLGAHRLAPVVEAARWDMHRALALAGGADPQEWPEIWTGERGPSGEMVDVAPGFAVASPMRLPLDPHQRAWLLDDLAIHTAQVIGRSRGAQHVADGGAPIPLWYAGPPLPLGKYGIRVVDVRDDPPGVRRSGHEYRSSLAADADRRAQIGVAAVRNVTDRPPPKSPTAWFDTINAWLRDHGLRGLSEHTWPSLVTAGLLDRATPPEILAEMESLLASAKGNIGRAGLLAKAIIAAADAGKPTPWAMLSAAMVLGMVMGTWSPPEPIWLDPLDRIHPPNSG